MLCRRSDHSRSNGGTLYVNGCGAPHHGQHHGALEVRPERGQRRIDGARAEVCEQRACFRLRRPRQHLPHSSGGTLAPARHHNTRLHHIIADLYPRPDNPVTAGTVVLFGKTRAAALRLAWNLVTV
jgi:hypothetical protein